MLVDGSAAFKQATQRNPSLLTAGSNHGPGVRDCMFRIKKLYIALLVLLATWISGVLVGQTVSTQILGLMTDPAGAAIPGATVTARRPATGDIRTTKTNESGNYIFPLLDVGDYEVTCVAAG